MTPPALAAWRFTVACVYGAGLGVVYSFLRPLCTRRTALADGLFSTALLFIWLQLMFRICRGDIRMGYTAGLGVGFLAWELTLGKLLRPVFFAFWAGISRLMGWILYPAVKIFKKIRYFCKFLFASLKKWVTIIWNNRRSRRRSTGGPYGKNQKIPVIHKTGLQKDIDTDKDRGVDGTCIVYGGDPDAPWRH